MREYHALIGNGGIPIQPVIAGCTDPLCFDEGLLTPKAVVNDVPVNYSGYAPENYDQKFNGYVTVEHALDHSLNIPAV